MKRSASILACACFALATDVAPQAIPASARDYLFASDVSDARALWVNPAGLGATALASIAATIVFDIPESAAVRVAQWSGTLSSRGFAFGYQRDRLISGFANDAFRFGLGQRFRGGAVGFAATFYNSNETNTGFDLGIIYQLMPSLNGALVVRNIGQPDVRGIPTPFSGTASATWTPLGARGRISAEISGTNRLNDSGYDISYRAGGRLIIGNQFPVQAFGVVEVDSDIEIARWSIGIAVGGLYRAVGHGTIVPFDAIPDQRLVGVTGIASNQPARSR